jgi:hypothetical protein
LHVGAARPQQRLQFDDSRTQAPRLACAGLSRSRELASVGCLDLRKLTRCSGLRIQQCLPARLISVSLSIRNSPRGVAPVPLEGCGDRDDNICGAAEASRDVMGGIFARCRGCC